MQDVVLTRVRQGGPPRPSRNLEERLIVRWPALYQLLAALVAGRLASRSRVRRTLLRRGIGSGWAAFSRRDFDLLVVRYAPEIELEFPPGQQTLGLSEKFRGHEAMAGALAELSAGWASVGLEPAYVLDLGDRVLTLGAFRVRGRASGLELEQEFAQLVALRNGLAVRDQAWFGWDEGLRAAGLEPDVVRSAFSPKDG